MKYFISLLALLVLLMVSSLTVHAANEACEIMIPVALSDKYHNISGDVVFTVHLEGVTDNAPMPKTVDISVRKSENTIFPPITFEQTGYYEYRICQKLCTDENITLDSTEYMLGVHILHDENNQLFSKMTLWKSGEQSKSEEILFVNSYTSTETTTLSTTTVSATVTVSTTQTTTAISETAPSKWDELVSLVETGDKFPAKFLIFIICLTTVVMCLTRKNLSSDTNFHKKRVKNRQITI